MVIDNKKVADPLADDVYAAKNKQREAQLRAALLEVNPAIDLSKVTITSDLKNKFIDAEGLTEAEFEQALSIVERKQDQS